MPTARPFLGALAFVIGCEAVGLTGAAVTNPGSDWYRALAKPSFQPPAWIFGPAWTLLYALMGLAAWRVWQRRAAPGARTALVLFGAHYERRGRRSSSAPMSARPWVIAVLAVLVAATTSLPPRTGRRQPCSPTRVGAVRDRPQRGDPAPQPLIARTDPLTAQRASRTIGA
jgi:tryptophan-rich sensory protein